jgi:prepilin-type N-terminal cleavage/methylation domain-containing protein
MPEINKKSKQNKNSGFTLLEILISIGIIAILSAAMLQVTAVTNTHKQLSIETNKVQSFIRMAQSYFLSIPRDVNREHICGFGFYPATNTIYRVFYVYNDNFESNPQACENTSNFVPSPSVGMEVMESETLKEGYEFNSFGESEAVFFKAPYGEIYQNGSSLSGAGVHTFRIDDQDGNFKEIKINGGGRIEID